MSSEKEFGLPEQPGPTCPMIDKVLKDLAAAEKILGQSRKYGFDADDYKRMVEDAAWELDGLASKLEEIRAHVSNIRDWGQAWKDHYKDAVRASENAPLLKAIA